MTDENGSERSITMFITLNCFTKYNTSDPEFMLSQNFTWFWTFYNIQGYFADYNIQGYCFRLIFALQTISPCLKFTQYGSVSIQNHGGKIAQFENGDGRGVFPGIK